MLDDLDKELEKRGHSFCRYADDCNIYVATQHSGERVLASITNYLETKLKLKVNHLKSAVDRPSRRIFLGYSFTGGKHSRIRVPKETTQKMKSKLRLLCRKGRGRNLRRFIAETLNPVLRGWTNYFRLSQTKTSSLGNWTNGYGTACGVSSGDSGNVPTLATRSWCNSGSRPNAHVKAASTDAGRGSTAEHPT
jgi:hypothetical protein